MEQDKLNSGSDNGNKKATPISIERELKSSFLDYAMSVIVSRALPDVRDGLKPVHRRILYAMHKLGLYNERPYRKSATVVGEVMGNFHPHGDGPIYQTMVGMAQDFARRYTLLDGQGNWGSLDGDSAAAMRYTEVRMEKITRDILADIEKQTVDFAPNFDESCLEPTVLPSRIPQLLVNGSNGIAVGMATSIPPHNLGEVVDACIAVIKDPELPEEELFNLVPAPDFPGGGIICGRADVIKAYRTGHGSVKLRGVVDIEEDSKKNILIIKEIPYQVNKADLITKIADLAKEKIIDGITNIRDESAREKVRVVIDLKRGESGQIILNQLYKHTQLKTSFPMIMLAILGGRPMVFNLREVIDQFIIHRREIVTRRSKFELKKSTEREHVLLGLITALQNIDEVVKMVKAANNFEAAQESLCAKFSFSQVQAKAILEMRLHKLTALEVDKLKEEIESIQARIAELEKILSDKLTMNSVITTELEKIKDDFADPRRTAIEQGELNMSEIDLVPNDEVVVTLTKKGYLKRVKSENYAVQHRGGKGKKGMVSLDEFEDVIQDVFVAKNHDNLLFFTNKGRVYSKHVFQVPEGSRIARGRAIANVLPLTEGETIIKLLCTSGLDKNYLVMITQQGVIKKTEMKAFAKIRSTGIQAVGLRENDELAFCGISTGSSEVVVATSAGQGIRFHESEVRAMGRQAAGVRAIKLKTGAVVVGMVVAEQDCDLLFATECGYGKRVKISNFRTAHRGGMGVRTIPVTGRNGKVVGMVKILENSNILLIDKAGKIIRLDPEEIRTMGRQARGVRLIRLDKGQQLSSVVAFQQEEVRDDEDTGSDDSGSGDGGGGTAKDVESGESGIPQPDPDDPSTLVKPKVEAPSPDAGQPSVSEPTPGEQQLSASDPENEEARSPIPGEIESSQPEAISIEAEQDWQSLQSAESVVEIDALEPSDTDKDEPVAEAASVQDAPQAQQAKSEFGGAVQISIDGTTSDKDEDQVES